jgi:hypothetical protein
MQVVPVAATPSQTLAIVLDNQASQLSLRQNGNSLYLSLQLDGVDIVLTRICRDRQLLLLDARYKGYQGDFMFLDLQGVTDPVYTGLGDAGRYVLVYLSESELPVGDPTPDVIVEG